MKKLNENVLRRLILETIDEQVLGEGKKKKKLKEVEPANSDNPLADETPETQSALEKAHTQTATGIAQTTGQTQSVPDPDVAAALDESDFSEAMEAIKSGDKMRELGGWQVLDDIADAIKKMSKTRK